MPSPAPPPLAHDHVRGTLLRATTLLPRLTAGLAVGGRAALGPRRPNGMTPSRYCRVVVPSVFKVSF